MFIPLGLLTERQITLTVRIWCQLVCPIHTILSAIQILKHFKMHIKIKYFFTSNYYRKIKIIVIPVFMFNYFTIPIYRTMYRTFDKQFANIFTNEFKPQTTLVTKVLLNLGI